MSAAETVSSTTSLDLYTEQTKDVIAMRSALLSFNKSDPNAARKALQNVTILRVYHQLERIVRYTEMIDKIEDRIYQSIDMKLENSDPDDEDFYFTLIPIAERLQKMMIESHKLLEPYLDMEQLAALDVPQQEEDPTQAFTSMILDQESREKVRTGIQGLMAVMNTLDSTVVEIDDQSGEQAKEQAEVQSKAQDALAKLQGQQSEEEQEETDG